MMLEIKFCQNFKGNEDFLVVTGNAEDYKAAAEYFRNKGRMLLADADCIVLNDLGPIDRGRLFFTKHESASFADSCIKVASAGTPSHDYFSASNMPDVDFLISCGEY